MLSAIFANVGMGLINSIFDKLLGAFTAYQNKQISMEELKTQLYGMMVGAFRDVEVSHSQALAKTYESFMGTMEKSLLMQRVWGFVTLSQLFVLLWHQMGIPFLVLIMKELGHEDFKYPSSGTTVDWAYLLLGACIGAAPLVLRSGPGAGNLTDRLKSLVGK
jgi:hypothetical protein